MSAVLAIAVYDGLMSAAHNHLKTLGRGEEYPYNFVAEEWEHGGLELYETCQELGERLQKEWEKHIGTPGIDQMGIYAYEVAEPVGDGFFQELLQTNAIIPSEVIKKWLPKLMEDYLEITEIKKNMALAFFASAWADQEEEAGEAKGGEIMDRMPDEVDPEAIKAAEKLAEEMCKLNDVPNIAVLYQSIPENHTGDRPRNPEMFGHYCAMQAMGHGVGLGDAFGSEVYETVKIPNVEFNSATLSKDYFE